ncbi:MAG: hypothetical protein EOO77_20055 [Oxalobacteraceae bacterium]|nr:MAG: hypothetical protein EOO77_20055 [Oxalobacteraceae bacterium]
MALPTISADDLTASHHYAPSKGSLVANRDPRLTASSPVRPAQVRWRGTKQQRGPVEFTIFDRATRF